MRHCEHSLHTFVSCTSIAPPQYRPLNVSQLCLVNAAPLHPRHRLPEIKQINEIFDVYLIMFMGIAANLNFFFYRRVGWGPVAGGEIYAR